MHRKEERKQAHDRHTLRAMCGLGVLAGLASGLSTGCGATPPPSPTVVSEPVASAAMTAEPMAPARVSLGPGEIRCGVDDGPVPIGSFDDDGDRLRPHHVRAALEPSGFAVPLRNADHTFLGEMKAEPAEPLVDAAKPDVVLTWTLGAALQTSPAFEARAHACGAVAELTDAGERSFAVVPSAQGSPLATRGPVSPNESSSKLSTCFASALCSLGPARVGATETANVQLVAAVSPAAYRGHVEITITDLRVGAFREVVTGRRKQRMRVSLPPPPRPKASQAYAKRMSERLRVGAEACAKQMVPARSFSTTVSFEWGKAGKHALPRGRGRLGPLVEAFDSCLTTAADAVLTKPPAAFNPNDLLPINVTVDVLPESPTPPGLGDRR